MNIFKLLATRKKYVLLLLLLVGFMGLLLRTNSASAASVYANPNTYLPASFYNEINFYDAVCPGGPNKYMHAYWVSLAGDARQNTQTGSLPYGTRYVDFQFNNFVFVCRDTVQSFVPDGNPANPIFLPKEGDPGGALQFSLAIIGNSTVTSGPGTLNPSPEGAWSVADRIDFFGVSRYWNAAPVTFRYDAGPGGLTSTTDIQIKIDSNAINSFGPAGNVCVIDGTSASDGCPWGTDYFNFRINIQPPPSPTVDIRANGSNGPVNVAINGNINLSWSTANATSCTASNGWSGSKSAGGGSETRSGPPNNDSAVTGTKTYRITCNGATGTTPASDSVTVNIVGPPVVDVKVNGFDAPPSIEINEGINVTWTITGVVTGNCTASNGWSGSKSAGGGSETRSGPPNNESATTGTRTYTLSCNGPGGPSSDTASINVVAKPYVQFYSGDVSAGDSFKIDGGACQTFGTGGINTYNNADSPNYTGSGSQLAAFARGTINEFVSAALQTATSTRPRALSFANTSPTYGGNFGSSSQCIEDYWADSGGTTVSASTLDLSSVSYPTGTYLRTGDLTIPGSVIPAGRKLTIFVDGNLTIANNITYANFTTLDQIPMLRLIVKGNVYINSAVSEISGNIIAIPKNDGTNGTMYTCTNGSSPGTSNWLAQNCGNQLTFYGAITARQLKLLRTFGTKRGSTWQPPLSSQAAERFINSPESWLTLPSSNTGVGNDNWDSITSLPPVL